MVALNAYRIQLNDEVQAFKATRVMLIIAIKSMTRSVLSSKMQAMKNLAYVRLAALLAMGKLPSER